MPHFQGLPRSPSVDSWPLVRGRSWFYSGDISISVDSGRDESWALFAEDGDVIGLPITSKRDLRQGVESSFKFCLPYDPREVYLAGTIVHSWTVGAGSADEQVFLPRAIDSKCTHRNKAIVNSLSTSTFCAASESEDAMNLF